MSEPPEKKLGKWAEYFSKIGSDPSYAKITSDDFLKEVKEARVSKGSPDDIATQLNAGKGFEYGNYTLDKAAANYQREKDHEHQVNVDVHSARLSYADRIFYLICFWIIAVLLLVFLDGAHIGISSSNNEEVYFLEIDNSVLIALITGLSVNVVGLFFAVLKWLYPNSKP